MDPVFYRRGGGRRLLREALHRIGPEAWTNTLAENEPALALYKAVGLAVVWVWPSTCEGHLCMGMRLALPTSRMSDPDAVRVRG